MKQSVIYAIDFDGVICDSALETGVSAWKAALTLWDDFSTPLPSVEMSEKFHQIRPIMGTGYEAILIIRLLNNGETVETIMQNYTGLTQQVMDESMLTIDSLKNLYGETRDKWIEQDLAQWVEMNPLFPGMAEKLQKLTKQGVWYIVTTKQERFVKKILEANQVYLPDENIFGLDRQRKKEDILIDLVNKHTEATIYFIEDMLPMLCKVLKNEQLTSVKLFFAMWGYNTAQDKLDAEKYDIKLVEKEDFLG